MAAVLGLTLPAVALAAQVPQPDRQAVKDPEKERQKAVARAARRRAKQMLAAGELEAVFAMVRDDSSSATVRRSLAFTIASYAMARSDLAQGARLLGRLANMRGVLSDGMRLWTASEQGQLAEKLQDYEQRAASLEVQRECEPAMALGTTSELVSVHVQLGSVAEAWRELDHLASLPQVGAPELALRRAEVLLACGQADRAERALRAVDLLPAQIPADGAAAVPVNPVVEWTWLDLELWSEQFEVAVEHVDRLEALGSSDPRARFGRARALERLDHPEAAAALLEIRDAESTSMRLRALAAAVLAQQRLRTGDVAAARELLDGGPQTAGVLERDLVLARVLIAELDRGAAATSARRDLRRTSAQLDATWRGLLTQWRELPVQVGGQAFLQNASRRDLLATCIACDLVLDPEHAAERAWQRLLMADSASTLARTDELPAATLAGLRDGVVPARGVLLAYVPAPLGSHVLWLSADEVAVIPMPSDRGLRAEVRKLHRELDRANHSRRRKLTGLLAAAEAVAGYVLPPALRQRLQGVERLAVYGRELLGGVAFELMPSSSDGVLHSAGASQWLGLAKALHYQPCLALAAARASQPRRKLERDVVLAAARCAEASAREHGVTAETLSASDLVGLSPPALAQEHWRTLSADSVTPRQLFAPTERVGVMLLFAHGIYAPERSCPAGLLVSPGADGGELYADALPAQSRAPAEMVVLCTCGAARGALRRGDDASRHLGGALLQLGTRVVGIADGDLELNGTKQLVAKLLEELARGAPPDLAMLRARRAVASGGTGHVADWSQIRLEGLAAQPLLAARAQPGQGSIRWPWLVGGVLVGGVLAAALVLLASRRLRLRNRSAAEPSGPA